MIEVPVCVCVCVCIEMAMEFSKKCFFLNCAQLWSLLTDLVHLTCSSSGTAQEDLAPVVSQLFDVPAIPGEEPCGGKT